MELQSGKKAACSVIAAGRLQCFVLDQESFERLLSNRGEMLEFEPIEAKGRHGGKAVQRTVGKASGGRYYGTRMTSSSRSLAQSSGADAVPVLLDSKRSDRGNAAVDNADAGGNLGLSRNPSAYTVGSQEGGDDLFGALRGGLGSKAPSFVMQQSTFGSTRSPREGGA